MSKRIHPIIKTVGLSLLTGILLIGGIDAAQEAGADAGYGMKRDRHDSRGHGFVSSALHHLLRHAKDLGVSEEQHTKLRTIIHDYAKTQIRGEADAKVAELEVQTLVHDQKSELPAIEKAMRKSADAELALRLEGVKAFRAATAVLTPEQREKWRGMLRSSFGHKEKGSNPDDDEDEEEGGEKKARGKAS
jgi:protein CpxP